MNLALKTLVLIFFLEKCSIRKMDLGKRKEGESSCSILIIPSFSSYFFLWWIEGNGFPLDCVCVTL